MMILYISRCALYCHVTRDQYSTLLGTVALSSRNYCCFLLLLYTNLTLVLEQKSFVKREVHKKGVEIGNHHNELLNYFKRVMKPKRLCLIIILKDEDQVFKKPPPKKGSVYIFEHFRFWIITKFLHFYIFFSRSFSLSFKYIYWQHFWSSYPKNVETWIKCNVTIFRLTKQKYT